ncbi:MAG: LPXTG cell wall anchor domain-containing protein [Oscillospiraceae bacterium]|nr:LPXTG cell wall anchor domain-containing protein [Oscillospiraceae bacterium]
MKKYLTIIAACTVLLASLGTPAIPASAETDAPAPSAASQETADAETERAYQLLKQYIAEEQANGNPCFRSANVFYPDEYAEKLGREPGAFDDKLILEYDITASDETTTENQQFTRSILRFMNENNIFTGENGGVDQDRFLITELQLAPTVPAETLERVYDLLNSYIDTQKAAQNTAFSGAGVYRSTDDLANEEYGLTHQFYADKVIVQYYYGQKESFLSALRTYMQENDIDENLVFYWELDSAEPADSTAAPTRRETILALNSTLTEYLRENNYFAVIAPETDAEAENLVTLTFWLTPEEAETFDREAVQAGVRSVCEARSLDPALVKVIFETETGAAADGEALWETRTALEDFIAEKGYNVGVHFIHDTTLPEVYGDAHAMIELSFPQAPASDMNRDDRISAEIGSMLQEKGLTGVPVTIISLADTAAPGESEATETTTTATETAATEAASATTTTTAAATTTTAATTTAAGTTTAAPPKTGDRAETGMLAAGIASLLAAAACTKRRKE